MRPQRARSLSLGTVLLNFRGSWWEGAELWSRHARLGLHESAICPHSRKRCITIGHEPDWTICYPSLSNKTRQDTGEKTRSSHLPVAGTKTRWELCTLIKLPTFLKTKQHDLSAFYLDASASWGKENRGKSLCNRFQLIISASIKQSYSEQIHCVDQKFWQIHKII